MASEIPEERLTEVRDKSVSPTCLLLIRLLGFAVSLQSILVHLYIRGNEWLFSFAYLTIQGASLATISLLLLAFAQCFECLRQTLCWKFIHIAFTLALSASVPICLMYWFSFYPEIRNDAEYWTRNNFFVQIELHTFIILFLLAEFHLDGLQVYKSHFIYIVLYSVFYLVFNYYITLNVRLVYKIMTWKDTISYVWAILALLLVCGSFFLFRSWGLKKLKQSVKDD